MWGNPFTQDSCPGTPWTQGIQLRPLFCWRAALKPLPCQPQRRLQSTQKGMKAVTINFTAETNSFSKQKLLADSAPPLHSDHTTCHSAFPFGFLISSFLGFHHLAIKESPEVPEWLWAQWICSTQNRDSRWWFCISVIAQIAETL